jgi:hypothetical protein
VTATVEIPAEHVSAFRLATVEEISHDAAWVKDSQEAFEEAQLRHGADARDDDVVGSTKSLQEVSRVLNQLDPESGEPATAAEDPTALAHILETMARKVAKQLVDDLLVSPFGAEQLRDVQRATTQLEWATHEACKLRRERPPIGSERAG